MKEHWGMEITLHLSHGPFFGPQPSHSIVVGKLSPLRRFAAHRVAFLAPIRFQRSHLHCRALQSIQRFTTTER